MMDNRKWNRQTTNMILALYVLSGVITKEQLDWIIKEDLTVPDSVEGIITLIKELNK